MEHKSLVFAPAFGGLLRDAIGSTMYWEIHRAVIWFRLNFDFILGPSGLDFGSTVEDLLTFSTSKPMKQQDSKTAKQQQERKKNKQQPKNPTSQQPNDLARRNARSA